MGANLWSFKLFIVTIIGLYVIIVICELGVALVSITKLLAGLMLVIGGVLVFLNVSLLRI